MIVSKRFMGEEARRAIVAALGLSDLRGRMRSLKVEMDRNSPVVVTVSYLASDEDMETPGAPADG